MRQILSGLLVLLLMCGGALAQDEPAQAPEGVPTGSKPVPILNVQIQGDVVTVTGRAAQGKRAKLHKVVPVGGTNQDGWQHYLIIEDTSDNTPGGAFRFQLKVSDAPVDTMGIMIHGYKCLHAYAK